MAIAVHVTHEAVHKVGGIGAVLAGLITADAYRQETERTVLVGPLTDRHRAEPLGPDGTVLYDNWNGVWADDVGNALYGVEVRHGTRIVYGRRPLAGPGDVHVDTEVLLVDVEGAVPHGLARYKYDLYQTFGLTSDRFEGTWEYELYVRLAEPAYDAVIALLGDRGDAAVHLVAHEFMGLPTAFKAILAGDPGVFTVFYAHEVATARRLVESLPGADAAFYGALRAAAGTGASMEDLFGPQGGFHKHALVRQAWRCDAVLAVGDLVVDELRFLGPEFAGRDIDRVYNGVPVAAALTAEEREEARRRLAGVAEGLLGWQPDLVLTHVGRLVPSKGLWRDLLLLEALEPHLREQDRSAALLVLATDAGPRLPASIAQMRADYDWPLVHREGYPDLTPAELQFDLQLRAHNSRGRCTRALFINQFGFDADSLAGAVAADVGFEDLRRGSDAELGQSTYEPFGIAQIEPLAHGAISVVSDACGCVGFLRQVAGEAPEATVYLCGDYSRGDGGDDPEAWRHLDEPRRRAGERGCSQRLAARLAAALPGDAAGREGLLTAGYAAAAAMSWEQVVRDQYLPALRRMEAARDG